MNNETQNTSSEEKNATQEGIPLSDGRKATFQKGYGHHMVKANQIASDPAAIPLALASLLTLIDGKPVIYEDLLEMPLSDVMKIQTAVMTDLGK